MMQPDATARQTCNRAKQWAHEGSRLFLCNAKFQFDILRHLPPWSPWRDRRHFLWGRFSLSGIDSQSVLKREVKSDLGLSRAKQPKQVAGSCSMQQCARQKDILGEFQKREQHYTEECCLQHHVLNAHIIAMFWDFRRLLIQDDQLVTKG